MELALIRHFQTKGNREKRYIGITDEPLWSRKVPEGKRYPEAEVVVASPMRRCVETARLIYPGKPRIWPAFRECDFGAFENHNYEELKEDRAYQDWIASGGTHAFPGGETAEEFRRRCTEGFLELAEELLLAGIERAALVVHGGTIMAIMEAFGMPRKAFYERQADNGGGYVVHLEESEWRRGIYRIEEVDVL